MMNGYGLTFFMALVIVVVATPISIKLAKHWGAIAYPGGRHIHSRPIPRLGGLAIYASFWITALVTQVWSKNIWGLFIGSTIIVAVGIWDDIREIRPLYKLYWQIAAATVLIFFDFSMDFISLPLLDEPLIFKSFGLSAVGLILMLFWVVGLVNTVNVSDLRKNS